MSEYEKMPKEAREEMDRAYTAKIRYKLTLEEWVECDGQKVWKEQPWTIDCVSLNIAGEDKEMLLSMMCKKLMEFAVPTLVLCEKRGIYGRDKGL